MFRKCRFACVLPAAIAATDSDDRGRDIVVSNPESGGLPRAGQKGQKFRMRVSQMSPITDVGVLNFCQRSRTGASMRILIACTIVLTAAIGLGGCFFHGWHQQAVTTQPLTRFAQRALMVLQPTLRQMPTPVENFSTGVFPVCDLIGWTKLKDVRRLPI